MIEREWIDQATGLRCQVVLYTPMGHRCGYVGLPPEHPLHGITYSEHVPFLAKLWEEAQKGTIGNRGIIPLFLACPDVASLDVVFNVHGSITFADYFAKDGGGLWWIGFDCAHAGDTPDNWTLDAVVAECESLAHQLAAVTKAEGE